MKYLFWDSFNDYLLNKDMANKMEPDWNEFAKMLDEDPEYWEQEAYSLGPEYIFQKDNEVEILTFNREDWSGQEITIQVNREEMSWEQSDYKFHLEETPEEFVDDELGMSMKTMKCMGSEWKEPLFTITKFSDSPMWVAASDNLMREDADPILCAAKLVCSIV